MPFGHLCYFHDFKAFRLVRFDHYLGVPYSHDMCPCHVCFPTGNKTCLSTCRPDTVSCPLYKDDKIIEQPVDLTRLDQVYTSEAVKFIEVSTEIYLEVKPLLAKTTNLLNPI